MQQYILKSYAMDKVSPDKLDKLEKCNKILNLYIYNANFFKNRMSSIQASIFRPRAPTFRVVVRYVEEMV